jgi:hypothetical protein
VGHIVRECDVLGCRRLWAVLLPAQAAAPIKIGRSAALGESCDLCICVFSVADQDRIQMTSPHIFTAGHHLLLHTLIFLANMQA